MQLIDRAAKIALSQKDDFISCEHLLLAILDINSSAKSIKLPSASACTIINCGPRLIKSLVWSNGFLYITCKSARMPPGHHTWSIGSNLTGDSLPSAKSIWTRGEKGAIRSICCRYSSALPAVTVGQIVAATSVQLV